nr:MAG TPA: restriction endonuclease [Caudoviricetes sp.]
MGRRCRICGTFGTTDRQGRCRLCREARAADDAGMSYGRYKSLLFQRYGEQPDLPLDWYRECPICHRLFLPKRKNHIYDTQACGQIAASRKYYKKRAGLGAPAMTTEDNHGPDAADQDGGGTHQNEPVAQNQKK